MELLIVAIIFIAIFLFVFVSMNKKSSNRDSYKRDYRDSYKNDYRDEREPDNRKSNRTPIKSSYLMSAHEKTMFGELKQSVPECHIFVQVAFGAILWTSSYATRNKFSQKIADFVVTDQNFKILAVIELDDKSHNGKESKDAERDEMLREAGYKVLRYPVMPPKDQLRSDILS